MTPEERLQKQIEIYRRMQPHERLQIAFDLYALARTLSRAGVRHQHPDWDEHQVDAEVNRRFRLAAGIPEEFVRRG
jgi:hypothetical protein